MFRKLAVHDLEALHLIYNQAIRAGGQTAHTQPLSAQYWADWFARRNQESLPVFVLEKNNRAVGWVSLSAYRPGRQALEGVAEISYYLETQSQRRGLGSKMLAFAIEQAQECGLHTLIAILLSANHASIRLLEKNGFRKWGTMPQIARLQNQTFDHLYYGRKI